MHITFSFHFGKPPALLASDSGPYGLSLDGFAGSTTLEVVAVSISIRRAYASFITSHLILHQPYLYMPSRAFSPIALMSAQLLDLQVLPLRASNYALPQPPSSNVLVRRTVDGLTRSKEPCLDLFLFDCLREQCAKREARLTAAAGKRASNLQLPIFFGTST